MPSIKNLLNDDENFSMGQRTASFYDEVPLEKAVENEELKLDFESSEDEEMPFDNGAYSNELTGMCLHFLSK